MALSSNSHFWATLLELDDQVDVKPLKDKEVWKAATTWSDAFVNDPLIRYMNDNEPDSPRQTKMKRLYMSGILLGWIRRIIVITVNSGASVVVASPAPSSVGPPSPKERVIDWMVKIALKLASRIADKERRRRLAEVKEKVGAVISEKIKERQSDMIYVHLVCTEPESQGHGYASALLDTITRMADMLETACWLESSNIANEAFYNSHGFKTVGEAIIGDSNPIWHEKPVVVQIMVREPRL